MGRPRPTRADENYAKTGEAGGLGRAPRCVCSMLRPSRTAREALLRFRTIAETTPRSRLRSPGWSSVACLLVAVGCGDGERTQQGAGAQSCGFQVDASLSEEVATVAIVEFSLAFEPEHAHVEFGLDESYGLTAPVTASGPSHRTLLLGMKPSHDYHARIVADGGGIECVSDDFVLTTGPPPNGLPTVSVTTLDPAARAGGYVVSAFLDKGPTFILDADGDYVWWHGDGEFGRAEQSFDGNFMWDGDRKAKLDEGRLRRVGMDGLDERSFPEFGDCHHDFTVLPDETVAFIERDPIDCDRIMERAPDGSVSEIINVRDAFHGTETCHTNSLHYHADDDSYTFSDLHQDAYAKVTRAGQVEWVLGGTTSDFTGDGAEWANQHGHEMIAPDRILFFNNAGPPSNSVAIEVALDFDTMAATRVWQYDGALQSPIFGDVQRLPNGNTLVSYGLAGVIHEVAPNGELVESLTFSLGGGLNYVTKRASLYGPPPVR
jgi:hypothetical protein